MIKRGLKLKSGCWIWPYSIGEDGYGHLGRNGKVFDAHKWMYELIIGKVPYGCELDHLCRNRACINPEHLEPVSHEENSWRGLNTKIEMKQVYEIRKCFGKMTQKQIAEKFGLSPSIISYIFLGKGRYKL